MVGRAANAVLIWRLEKGEHLAILDLLAGSTSLTSTVTSQLKLHMLSFLGLILIAIWTLSPVGGQASIRQLTIGMKTSSQSAKFAYMMPGITWLSGKTGCPAAGCATVNTLFVASLIAPAAIKKSPRDLWGSVKIPMIESYENVSAPDKGGWYNTTEGDHTFSSLVGIPMHWANAPGYTYHMNLETSYLHLDCHFSDNKHSAPSNASCGGGACIWWSANAMKRRTETNITDLRPLSFSYIPASTFLRFAECTIVTSYVEVDLSCPSASTCGAARIRRSQLSHPPRSYTQLDEVGVDGQPLWEPYANDFVHSITGQLREFQEASVVGSYLMDPENTVVGVSIYTLLQSNEVYSRRLGQLMNSYWICMSGVDAITDPDQIRTHGFKREEQGLIGNITTTEGTESINIPVIESHLGWVITLCITSMVMITASLVNPIVRIFLNHGPDLMLNISSLATRNNPYIPLPTNGTFMLASDRARYLKDLKVRFGDVEPDSDVGSLAIASLDSEEVSRVAGVRKGRLYQ